MTQGIEVRNVHKLFRIGDAQLHVLKSVSLTIGAGEFVGIMGPSGSGKSTLLYLIGGLDRPTDGQIAVGGARLDTMSSDDLAYFRSQTVGFVFQSFHLVPTLTALENVALPGIFAKVPHDARMAHATALLHKLKMSDRAEHRPSQLSGGQQQRVAIARALFNDPPIIMCDEPTGALDTQTGRLVMRMLRALCTRAGKTVVVVTHDPGIENYADRMILLRDGRVIDDYATRQRPALDALEESVPNP